MYTRTYIVILSWASGSKRFIRAFKDHARFLRFASSRLDLIIHSLPFYKFQMRYVDTLATSATRAIGTRAV